MTFDTAVLADLAAKATPGPWTTDLDIFDSDLPEIEATVEDGPINMLFCGGTGIVGPSGPDDPKWAAARESQAFADAAYIAAFSPDVAAALLSEIESLRKVRDAAAALMESPRSWTWRHDERAALQAALDGSER